MFKPETLTSLFMGSLDGFGTAMQLLRIRAGVRSQGEWSRRAQIALGTVNKIETGQRLPDFETARALLDAIGADLHALASAIDEVNGRSGSQPGKPRARWISSLTLRPHFDVASLQTFLSVILDADDPTAAADFIASVEEAARGLAVAAMNETARLANVRNHPARTAELEAEERRRRGEYTPDEIRGFEAQVAETRLDYNISETAAKTPTKRPRGLHGNTLRSKVSHVGISVSNAERPKKPHAPRQRKPRSKD